MKVKISEINLTNIANSIRAKLSVQTLYKPSEMSGAIDTITSHTEEAKENLKKFLEHTATEITIPNGATKILSFKFYEYSGLKKCILPDSITEIGNSAFRNCQSLYIPNLPSGLTKIGTNAFYWCFSLKFTTLPANLVEIGSSAFDECTGLKTITFEGTPTTIANTAFNRCSRITTINVPWSSGAVSGAPWGATNATVVYNYTP